MNWARRLTLAACAAVAIFGMYKCGTIEASHLEILPDTPTVVMNRVLRQGFVTYALDKTSAQYPGFRQQAADVAQAGNEYVGIPAYEVDSRPDIWLTMPSDAEFLRTCGDGAAACILYFADPIVVFFRKSLFYPDWKTAIAHEGINYGHAMGQHERYIDSGGQLKCDPNATYTVMSCGTGIWQPQTYDRNIVHGFFVPDRPEGLLMTVDNGWATIWWNKTRRDGGRAHHGNSAIDNATRVAFAHSDNPASPIRFLGELGCGQEFNFCYSDPNDLHRSFDSYWSGCLWVRMESNVVWWVRQPSAPKYWSLAGCYGIGGYNEFTQAAAWYFGGYGGDATCIGWYESLLNPAAEGSFLERGSLQIHPIHFDYGRRSYLGYTWDDMFQTWPNLRVGKQIFNDSASFYGNGWRPWATKDLCEL